MEAKRFCISWQMVLDTLSSSSSPSSSFPLWVRNQLQYKQCLPELHKNYGFANFKNVNVGPPPFLPNDGYPNYDHHLNDGYPNDDHLSYRYPNEHLNDGYPIDEHLNDGHFNDEHINEGYLNDNHLNDGYLNDDHLKDGYPNHEHLNDGHFNDEHIN